MSQKLEITYAVECLPEEERIEGNCSAVDPETDQQTADWIRDQLNNGNEWAWCCIKVTASIDGIDVVGTDYLGCCSYKSESDFCRPGGYYDDMKEVAKRDMLEKLKELKAQLTDLELEV